MADVEQLVHNLTLNRGISRRDAIEWIRQANIRGDQALRDVVSKEDVDKYVEGETGFLGSELPQAALGLIDPTIRYGVRAISSLVRPFSEKTADMIDEPLNFLDYLKGQYPEAPISSILGEFAGFAVPAGAAEKGAGMLVGPALERLFGVTEFANAVRSGEAVGGGALDKFLPKLAAIDRIKPVASGALAGAGLELTQPEGDPLQGALMFGAFGLAHTLIAGARLKPLGELVGNPKISRGIAYLARLQHRSEQEMYEGLRTFGALDDALRAAGPDAPRVEPTDALSKEDAEKLQQATAAQTRPPGGGGGGRGGPGAGAAPPNPLTEHLQASLAAAKQRAEAKEAKAAEAILGPDAVAANIRKLRQPWVATRADEMDQLARELEKARKSGDEKLAERISARYDRLLALEVKGMPDIGGTTPAAEMPAEIEQFMKDNELPVGTEATSVSALNASGPGLGSMENVSRVAAMKLTGKQGYLYDAKLGVAHKVPAIEYADYPLPNKSDFYLYTVDKTGNVAIDGMPEAGKERDKSVNDHTLLAAANRSEERFNPRGTIGANKPTRDTEAESRKAGFQYVLYNTGGRNVEVAKPNATPDAYQVLYEIAPDGSARMVDHGSGVMPTQMPRPDSIAATAKRVIEAGKTRTMPAEVMPTFPSNMMFVYDGRTGDSVISGNESLKPWEIRFTSDNDGNIKDIVQFGDNFRGHSDQYMMEQVRRGKPFTYKPATPKLTGPAGTPFDIERFEKADEGDYKDYDPEAVEYVFNKANYVIAAIKEHTPGEYMTEFYDYVGDVSIDDAKVEKGPFKSIAAAREDIKEGLEAAARTIKPHEMELYQDHLVEQGVVEPHGKEDHFVYDTYDGSLKEAPKGYTAKGHEIYFKTNPYEQRATSEILDYGVDADKQVSPQQLTDRAKEFRSDYYLFDDRTKKSIPATRDENVNTTYQLLFRVGPDDQIHQVHGPFQDPDMLARTVKDATKRGDVVVGARALKTPLGPTPEAAVSEFAKQLEMQSAARLAQKKGKAATAARDFSTMAIGDPVAVDVRDVFGGGAELVEGTYVGSDRKNVEIQTKTGLKLVPISKAAIVPPEMLPEIRKAHKEIQEKKEAAKYKPSPVDIREKRLRRDEIVYDNMGEVAGGFFHRGKEITIFMQDMNGMLKEQSFPNKEAFEESINNETTFGGGPDVNFSTGKPTNLKEMDEAERIFKKFYEGKERGAPPEITSPTTDATTGKNPLGMNMHQRKLVQAERIPVLYDADKKKMIPLSKGMSGRIGDREVIGHIEGGQFTPDLVGQFVTADDLHKASTFVPNVESVVVRYNPDRYPANVLEEVQLTQQRVADMQRISEAVASTGPEKLYLEDYQKMADKYPDILLNEGSFKDKGEARYRQLRDQHFLSEVYRDALEAGFQQELLNHNTAKAQALGQEALRVRADIKDMETKLGYTELAKAKTGEYFKREGRRFDTNGGAGIFYTDQPAPQFGNKLRREVMEFHNPFVSSDAAAYPYAELVPPEIVAKFVSDLHDARQRGGFNITEMLNNPEVVKLFHDVDLVAINEAIRRGHDGIISKTALGGRAEYIDIRHLADMPVKEPPVRDLAEMAQSKKVYQETMEKAINDLLTSKIQSKANYDAYLEWIRKNC